MVSAAVMYATTFSAWAARSDETTWAAARWTRCRSKARAGMP
jgi:hypothetical protein